MSQPGSQLVYVTRSNMGDPAVNFPKPAWPVSTDITSLPQGVGDTSKSKVMTCGVVLGGQHVASIG